MTRRLVYTLVLVVALATPAALASPQDARAPRRGQVTEGSRSQGADHAAPPITPPPGAGVEVPPPTAGADAELDPRRREIEKHQRRMALIERIESLATTGNNARLRQKATHLRELEERRHEAALERLLDLAVQEGKAAGQGGKAKTRGGAPQGGGR